MELATDARAAEPRARLYLAADLARGTSVELAGDQAHYVTRVMRLIPGETVAVFNGRHGEWLAEITSVGKNRCTLRARSQRRAQEGTPDLLLLFAPIKRQPLDLLVRQATELGARSLQPVITARTVPERVNLERMRAICIEAAEQCERLDVPMIGQPERLDRALARWETGRRLFVCDETGQGKPVAAALAETEPGPAAVLCGPEGGFTTAELDALGDLPFVTRVVLGPRILRAETAALAVIAVWQAVRGDWGQASPRRAVQPEPLQVQE